MPEGTEEQGRLGEPGAIDCDNPVIASGNSPEVGEHEDNQLHKHQVQQRSISEAEDSLGQR
jgi:hypothetical protein